MTERKIAFLFVSFVLLGFAIIFVTSPRQLSRSAREEIHLDIKKINKEFPKGTKFSDVEAKMQASGYAQTSCTKTMYGYPPKKLTELKSGLTDVCFDQTYRCCPELYGNKISGYERFRVILNKDATIDEIQMIDSVTIFY